MIFYIVLFLVMTTIYFFVSYKKKNFIHILFFQMLGIGILMIAPNIIYLLNNKNYFSFSLGDFYQIFYVLAVYIFTTLLELNLIKFNSKLPKLKDKKLLNVFWILIVLLITIYFSLNYKMLIQAISNPRMFYATTRLGGGFIYYIIIPLIVFCYFYFIAHVNIKKDKFKLITIFFATAVICFIIYFFGQKAVLLLIGYLLLTTMAFQNYKNKNKIVVGIGLSFLILGIIFFALYSKQQNIEIQNIFTNIAGYSDYIRNFNDLVNELDHFHYGTIFLQDEIFSYIPRAIWHNKPELFGSLTLGLHVPRLVDATMAKTGAPSFGVLGAAYADFGFFGIFLKLMIQFAFIIIAVFYEKELSKKYNFWHHLIFLMFVGAPIFSITLVTFPLYQIVVIFVLYNFFATSSLKKYKEVI